jgi:hypothetical protein
LIALVFHLNALNFYLNVLNSHLKAFIIGFDYSSLTGYFDNSYYYLLLHILTQQPGFMGSFTAQEISDLEAIFDAAQNRYTYQYYFQKLATDVDNLEANSTFMVNLIQACYNNEDYDDERNAYFHEMDLFLRPTEFALGQVCKDKLLEIQA